MNRARWWILTFGALTFVATTVLLIISHSPPSGGRGDSMGKLTPPNEPAAGPPWMPKSSTLPWAPPRLDQGHRTARVSDKPSSRLVRLDADEDCLVVLPTTPLSDYGPVGTNDALVTVVGGRNVVMIGGHIKVQRTPWTTLTTNVESDASILTVESTKGFPTEGVVRVDGEGMRYSALDDTHLYIEDRRYGFFNDSEVSSEGAHLTGARVYLDERNRSAVSFREQTGTVHVEGLLIDGFVNDGLRFSGGKATVQIQRTRIGPNTNVDLAHQTDGHPDGIQAFDGGAEEIRLAQVSLLTGPNGNGLLNKGSDSGEPVPTWRLRHVEVVTRDGRSRSLIANSDPSTSWHITDSWLRHPWHFKNAIGDRTLLPRFRSVPFRRSQADIVQVDSVGIGYASAGYTR